MKQEKNKILDLIDDNFRPKIKAGKDILSAAVYNGLLQYCAVVFDDFRDFFETIIFSVSTMFYKLKNKKFDKIKNSRIILPVALERGRHSRQRRASSSKRANERKLRNKG